MTTRIRRHATTVLAAAFLLAGALAACTPQPAPQPSPTGFASEEEAFAAAEATYRAYVDAVNARQSGDNTGPAPSDFLTGVALSEEIAADAESKRTGRTAVGTVGITSVSHLSSSSDTASIHVCLDLSDSRIVDSVGVDVTPEGRPTTFSAEVDVVATPGVPLVAASSASELPC